MNYSIQKIPSGSAIPEQSNTLPGKRQKDSDTLKRLSADFESLLIGQMLKTMRASVPKNGLIDGGKGEEMFNDLLDQEYANKYAHNGDSGLSKALYEQLMRREKGK